MLLKYKEFYLKTKTKQNQTNKLSINLRICERALKKGKKRNCRIVSKFSLVVLCIQIYCCCCHCCCCCWFLLFFSLFILLSFGIDFYNINTEGMLLCYVFFSFFYSYVCTSIDCNVMQNIFDLRFNGLNKTSNNCEQNITNCSSSNNQSHANPYRALQQQQQQ